MVVPPDTYLADPQTFGFYVLVWTWQRCLGQDLGIKIKCLYFGLFHN